MEPAEAPSCDVTSLYNLLVDTGRQKLVLDVRTLPQYLTSCIRGSLWYPAEGFSVGQVPAVGKKLQAQAPIEMPPDWVEKEDKSISMRGLLYHNCVVVDDAGALGGEAARIAALLKAEGKVKNVSYLQGGFSLFSQMRSLLISSKEKNSRAAEGALPSEIVPGFLFLGSAENASSITQLRALGITHILNMADELMPHDQVPIHEFQYKKCSLDDTVKDRLDAHVDEALSFIQSARNDSGKILVHCAMGISRSSAITIAYLMKSEGMLFEDAQAMVKSRRSIINPNAGFVAQLRSIESKLVGK